MTMAPSAASASRSISRCAMMLSDAWQHAVSGEPRAFPNQQVEEILAVLKAVLRHWRTEIEYTSGSSRNHGVDAEEVDGRLIESLSPADIDTLIAAIDAIDVTHLANLDADILPKLRSLSYQLCSTADESDGPHF